MVYKPNSNLKKYEKGVTLIELVAVVFIIILFTMIVISDFPRIQRQLALSRVTYKLSQDFRKTQDLGLSGIKLSDKNNSPIFVQGYGIYMDIKPADNKTTRYLIYADINGNQMYDGDFATTLCSQVNQTLLPGQKLQTDCIIQIFDISDASQGGNPNLFIKSITADTTNALSIMNVNFTPPNPTVRISDGTITSNYSNVMIVLGMLSDTTAAKTVLANKSGLISVQ